MPPESYVKVEVNEREVVNEVAPMVRTRSWAIGLAIVYSLASLLFARMAADILKAWHMPGNIDTAALAIWVSVLFMGISMIYVFIAISRKWRT